MKDFVLKNLKRIFLLSVFFTCLIGFCSFGETYFCNNCGAKITYFYSASTSGTNISINSISGAWTTHKNSSVCVNNITGKKCKKENICVYSDALYEAWEEKQRQFDGLSQDAIERIVAVNQHEILLDMVSEIFTVNTDGTVRDEDANNIFSTYNMMNSMTTVCINGLKSFNQSSLYFLFSFIGILFVIINYSINFFQNSYNSEGKTHEQYLRMSFQVVLSIFLVCSVGKFSEFFLNFFRYVLDFVWNFTSSGVLVAETIDSSEVPIAIEITYSLLSSINAVQDGVLEEILSSVPYALLCVKFFIPYIICIVGKFGILFAIMNCCITTMAYCFLFPIAAGDVNENIRQSKLIRYSKKIMAGALQLSVIVIILLVCQVLSNGFIKLILSQITTTRNANYYEIAFVMAVMQVVKVVACNSGAKQIASAVSGE